MKSIINNNVTLLLLRILLVVFICAGPLESAYAQDRLLSVKIENETLKDALKQIEDKGYADKYADMIERRNLKVHKIGISFSSETRSIAEWKCI